MEITKNHIIIIFVILISILIYITYISKETFSVEWPKYWESTPPTEWGQWYYNNNEYMYHPIVPSVGNYNNSEYKFPKNSQKMLEKLDENIHRSHIKPNMNNEVPIMGNDNIKQMGSPLEEVHSINIVEPSLNHIPNNQISNFDELTEYKQMYTQPLADDSAPNVETTEDIPIKINNNMSNPNIGTFIKINDRDYSLYICILIGIILLGSIYFTSRK